MSTGALRALSGMESRLPNGFTGTYRGASLPYPRRRRIQRERKLVLNRQHKRKNGVPVGRERVPTILVRKSSAKPIKTIITYTIITLLCQNTCKKARVSRVPERNAYLALQEHVKLVSAERVAASVVSGPVKNCNRVHAQLPVYNKGQKSVEKNGFFTNTEAELNISAALNISAVA